jgi:retinol-binding protein 3
MTIRSRTLTAVVAVVAIGASPGPSTPAHARAEGSLQARTRRTVVTELIRQLQARYLFPDSVPKIAAHLGSRLRAGGYDHATNPATFGSLVTQDLVRFDRHFDLRFDTERERALLAAGSDTSAVLPELDPTPDSLAGLRRDNFGFRAAEILPGNVGYLRIDHLHDLRFARTAAVAGVEFLANSDAMIVDLREAPGGYGSMVQFLTSTFLGADSVELLTRYDRELGTTQRGWSNPRIADRHLPRVDVYLLTSGSTGSAAEALVYVLQMLKRATVVGERTAGAAHSGGWVPLRNGFVAFIPNARGFDPRTGRDWEGVGIQPDIEAPASRALERAHAEAVRRLLARESDPRRARAFQWLLPLLERRAAGPLALSDSLVQRDLGSYERCEVRLEQGALHFVGASGHPQRLVPLSEDTFLIDDERFAPEAQVRVRFVAGPDAAPALELLVSDGRVLRRSRIVH